MCHGRYKGKRDKDLCKDRERERRTEGQKGLSEFYNMPPAKDFKDLPRSSIVSLE